MPMLFKKSQFFFQPVPKDHRWVVVAPGNHLKPVRLRVVVQNFSGYLFLKLYTTNPAMYFRELWQSFSLTSKLSIRFFKHWVNRHQEISESSLIWLVDMYKHSISVLRCAVLSMWITIHNMKQIVITLRQKFRCNQDHTYICKRFICFCLHLFHGNTGIIKKFCIPYN